MTRPALIAIVLAGCLEVPTGPPVECSVDSDCNTSAGEECFEGSCYGDPPLGMYAASLSVPITREDLIATELPTLALPRNGNLGQLLLEKPITFSGRVETACTTGQTNCATTSIGAQVRITRPSRISGGPVLRLVAISKSGVPRGTDSFSIFLPPMHAGDPPYTVTIDPEGGGDMPPTHGGKDPAQVVPPMRLQLTTDSALEHQTYSLGGSVQLSGVLKDGLGATLTKYRVVALGRWDMTSAPTEVSSVHYSTDGTYSIAIADGVVGAVELVATPYDPSIVAAELHIGAVETYTQVKNLYAPTGLGSRVDISIPIKALFDDGGVKPVPGTRVVITGSTEASFTSGVRAVLSASTTTGDDGMARLSLLDGDALLPSYRVWVLPPGGSSAGIVFDEGFSMASPLLIQLPQRVAIIGRLVDTSGAPLADVSVTARRSLRFLWSLEAPFQAFLDEIPAATGISREDGSFVIWIDASVGATWGHYDLFFETPDRSPAPNWLIPDFEIPRIPGQMTIDLEYVTIPDAAFLHGVVVDGNGAPVDGSALRIFRLSDNESLCREVANAPLECSDDAKVMGHAESDESGIVRPTLPRP